MKKLVLAIIFSLGILFSVPKVEALDLPNLLDTACR